ncbi:MAG TPA: DUF4214 domain-containing protein [Iamia sp.]
MPTSTIRLIGAGLALAIGLTLGVPPAGAGTPPTADQVFVERLYANVLGRPATSGETGYWLQQLAAGRPRTTVAVRVAGSREGRGVLITRLYDHAFDFDRVPSAAERDYWVGRLAAGRSVEAVWADVTLSPEVHQVGGGAYFPDTNVGQALHFYAFYLSRLPVTEPPEAMEGVNYWADRIAADPSSRGVHRTALAFGRSRDATTTGLGRGWVPACAGLQSLTPAQSWTLTATWAAARHDLVRLAAVAVAVVCPTG